MFAKGTAMQSRSQKPSTQRATGDKAQSAVLDRVLERLEDLDRMMDRLLESIEQSEERRAGGDEQEEEQTRGLPKGAPPDRAALHSEVIATLKRLTLKHPELKRTLQKAYGFAVFPSVGRASLVMGGARGYGEVFEQGEIIGTTRVTQVTVGVQVGGQTFSELLIFERKPSLKAFKASPMAFNANASALFIAGGSGTTDFKDVTAHAYTRGGMLLEASLGGQKFRFFPDEGAEAAEEEEVTSEASGNGHDAAADEDESSGDGKNPVSNLLGNVGRAATKGITKALTSTLSNAVTGKS